MQSRPVCFHEICPKEHCLSETGRALGCRGSRWISSGSQLHDTCRLSRTVSGRSIMAGAPVARATSGWGGHSGPQ
eukprot:2022871-Pyramimonas_sp.AAC.1